MQYQHKYSFKQRKVVYTWNGVMFSHFIPTPLCIYRPILFHPYLCEFVFAEENRSFQFDSSGNIPKFIFIVLDHDDMLLANICPVPYQVNIYNSYQRFLSHFQFLFCIVQEVFPTQTAVLDDESEYLSGSDGYTHEEATLDIPPNSPSEFVIFIPPIFKKSIFLSFL